MKVLFTTPVLEYPSAGGPALRITNSIKALGRISELHLISRVNIEDMGGEQAHQLFKSLVKDLRFCPSVYPDTVQKLLMFRIATKYRLLNSLVNILPKTISKLIGFNSISTDSRFIADYYKRNGIDIIWFGYGNISFELMKTIRKILPSAKLVCDTDSVWSRFILRELDHLKDENRREEITQNGLEKEREEKEWVKFIDVTTAVSEIDAEYYRSISPEGSEVKLFSNVIDVDMYSDKPKPPVYFPKPAIYLAGTFWKNSPMEQAARWVITEIFPYVLRKFPEAHLYIIGKNSDKVLHDFNESNIVITGKLDSVLPYLCNADVALVPLKFESGTRFKILEAGACGVPIVSTILGAEGIPVENRKHLLIADSSQHFAESIIEILKDELLSKHLALNCQKLIESSYSIDSLMREGFEIFKTLSESEK